MVALRKESVDRNILLAVPCRILRVALRKESVDRNPREKGLHPTQKPVALRKESVDRNYKERPGQKARPKSLSARRAWIEILLVYLVLIRYLSLSARRAWIEILLSCSLLFSPLSLSARRAWIEIMIQVYTP